MSILIPAAYADAGAPAAACPVGTGFELVFLVGFLVIFYLIIWRPQATRAKEHKNLLGNLQKGDEVVTSGCISRKVTKVAVDFVVLEVSDNFDCNF
ncbi:preprotein translocase subunit YajC [Pseudomonas aeruginosa]